MLISSLALASVPTSAVIGLDNRIAFREQATPCILSNGKVARAPTPTGLYFGSQQFTAEHVHSVEPAIDQNDARPTILLRFSFAGAEQLLGITRSNVGNALPIFVDGDLLACPTVLEPITGGEMQIAGSYTTESAALAANRIRSTVGIPSQP